MAITHLSHHFAWMTITKRRMITLCPSRPLRERLDEQQNNTGNLNTHLGKTESRLDKGAM